MGSSYFQESAARLQAENDALSRIAYRLHAVLLQLATKAQRPVSWSADFCDLEGVSRANIAEAKEAIREFSGLRYGNREQFDDLLVRGESVYCHCQPAPQEEVGGVA